MSKPYKALGRDVELDAFCIAGFFYIVPADILILCSQCELLLPCLGGHSGHRRSLMSEEAFTAFTAYSAHDVFVLRFLNPKPFPKGPTPQTPKL